MKAFTFIEAFKNIANRQESSYMSCLKHMQHFCSVKINISRVTAGLFKHGHLASEVI